MKAKLLAALWTFGRAFAFAFLGVVVSFGTAVLDQPWSQWKAALAAGVAAVAFVAFNALNPRYTKYGIGSK